MSLCEELKVSDNVFFLGFIDRNMLHSIYQRAFAVIYPSLLGPDNLPPLEAMYLDCPVLVSDSIGHQEQFGEAALYFDPLDPESIASKILEISSDFEVRNNLLILGKKLTEIRTVANYIDKINLCISKHSGIIKSVSFEWSPYSDVK